MLFSPLAENPHAVSYKYFCKGRLTSAYVVVTVSFLKLGDSFDNVYA
jgi:hypothetical protein